MALKFILPYYQVIHKQREVASLFNLYYYTSEESFLYKTSVNNWTIQHFTLEMNYSPVHVIGFFYYCTFFYRRFSAFREI